MSHDPAPRRFALMQLVRLGGVMLLLAGLMALQGRLGIPQWAGYLMILAAIGLFFAGPRALAKRWRSPPP